MPRAVGSQTPMAVIGKAHTSTSSGCPQQHLPAVCGTPGHPCPRHQCPALIPRHMPLLPHSPAAAHSAHAECFTPLPTWPTGLWPAGRATTHRTAMLPHILCVSGRQLEQEQFPSLGTHAMSGCSEDLNLPSAAPCVPPFRPGLADWGLTLPGQCRWEVLHPR